MDVSGLIVDLLGLVVLYGILVLLLTKIVLGTREKNHKQILIYGSILLILIVGVIFVSKGAKLVIGFSIVLRILTIYFLVAFILAIRHKQLKNSIMYILLLALFLFYGEVIREKGIIVGKLKYPLPSTDPISTYTRKFRPWRLPISINDIKNDSVSSKELAEIFRLREIEQVFDWSPGLIRKPDFGLKTWIEDTIIYSTLYSYGFDNDDDNFVKKINLKETKSKLFGNPYITLYVFTPFSLDGDIELIEYSHAYSIYDYHLDTTFVRQLFELQGDTLSPEEYKNWLEKREGFFEQERLFWSK